MNRGVVFSSHMNGRAKHLCAGINKDVLEAKDGTDMIVDAVYKLYYL